MLSRLAFTLMLMPAVMTDISAAQSCSGRPAALGTSRVLRLNPVQYRKLGLIEYDETLPLNDREAVLTFDDGPIPPFTTMVLDALAAECVKATFFIVGEQAAAHPAILLRAYREGHTIGTHTEHHPHLDLMPAPAIRREITGGIAAASKILGSDAVSPFFRFPYLEDTRAAETIALRLGLTIWSADVHVSDWNKITPDQVAALALERLERKGKGILLLHDIHERTARALPAILRGLKDRRYSIVHVIPARSARPEPEAKSGDATATN